MKHAWPVLLGMLCLLTLPVDARAQASTPAGEVAPAAPVAPHAVPPAPQLEIPLQLAIRERRLARDLAALGARDSGRVTSGIVQLAVGAGFTTLGALLKNQIGRSLLILLGAGTMAHGGAQLGLSANANGLALRYRDLPMMTRGLAFERVRFGEDALAAIARGARRGRIANGTVTMTIAAMYVPLLWWLQGRDDPSYAFGDSAFDYVALALSGINFATGMVTALVSTDAERRLQDYQALRARVTSPTAGAPARRTLTFGLVPARAGAAFAGGLKF